MDMGDIQIKARRNISEGQLWILFDNTPMQLLATLVNAIVITIIFSSVIEDVLVQGWLLAMMGVMAGRYILFLNFKKHIQENGADIKWVTYFAIGLVATALVWALSVPLFFPQSSLSDQLLLSFVLGGMVAGELSVSAYHFYMYAIYNVPILFVLMLYIFMSGNYYFGWMIILFMLMTLANAKRMYKNALKVRQLQEKNDLLIESLKKETNAVNNALDEATKANRLKDLFIGNISHEFRTPLNAIQGFSQVLQHRPDTPDNIMLMLKKIYASGNQLLVLLDVLMQYSKYKSGTLEYIPTKGSVYEIISTLVSQERVRILEKNLTFEIDIPANIMIEADFIMLKFIFNIMIEDAIENASNESVIAITAMVSLENDNYKVNICNDSAPLPNSEAENIFNPFTQMENSHESRNLARGLGLYVAKAMVEDFHKGSLLLEDNPLKGYCLVMSIPKK